MRPTTLLVTAAVVSIVLTLGLDWGAGYGLPGGFGADDAPPAAAGELTVAGIDGVPISTAELHGSIVVLDFWATWCGPCLTEIDDYNDLHDDYADRGVRVFGVTMESGDAATIAGFARQHEIAYDLAIGDETALDGFGPFWGYPTTLLIDRDWKVRGAWLGASRAKIADLRRRIGDLLVTERSSSKNELPRPGATDRGGR